MLARLAFPLLLGGGGQGEVGVLRAVVILSGRKTLSSRATPPPRRRFPPGRRCGGRRRRARARCRWRWPRGRARPACAGERFCVHERVEPARPGIEPDRIAVLHPRDRPARRGLRRDVDGRRHLARGAGHAPVGDQRHAEAALLQGAEHRRQRVQLGHAVGLRALEAQHADEIALQRAALERGLHRVLIVEDAGRGLDDVTLGPHRRGLDHGLAEIAAQHGEPAGGLEGIGRRAQDLSVQARARAVAPFEPALAQHRLLRVAGQSVARDGAHVAVQQPGVEQLADHEAEPAGGMKMVHVGEPVGIDPRHQRGRGGKRRHVGPLDQHAGGTGHRHEVQGQVGGAPRGMQADHAVDEGALVEHRARGRVGVAAGGDLERAARRRTGQRVAERRAGVDEAGTRQVQAHELHQHLVRVRRAVEGAGAGPVVGGHLGRHQRVPADLALGEALAHGGLLVVGQARGHRPRRHEERRHVAEGGGRDHQAGDDLVADAEEESGVEAVVRERHAGRERDHVPAEERELHAGLALGHAVAHRRHAACDLGGAARLARRVADQRGIARQRLVGREHVVVGGDDADVSGGAFGLARLVGLRAGREGVGEVAAGEMRPRRPGVRRPCPCARDSPCERAGSVRECARSPGARCRSVASESPVRCLRAPSRREPGSAHPGPAAPGLPPGRPHPPPARAPRAWPGRGSARSTGPPRTAPAR